MVRSFATASARASDRARIERSAPARCIAIVFAALGLCACAATSDSTEYGLYRSYRHQLEHAERLRAANDYLRAYPNGRFADEVRGALFDMGEGIGAHERLPTPIATASEHAAEPPRATVLRWLGALLALRAWNQPFSSFLGANGGFSDAFDGEPVPHCDPFGCTKTVPLTCEAAAARAGSVPRPASMQLTLIVRSTVVAGVDLTFDFDAFGAWHACDVGIHPDASAAAPSAAAWGLEVLRQTLVARFPAAQPTPAALTGRELDRTQPGPVNSDPGQVQWSYLVRCDAGGCLRIDGFFDARRPGDGGVRVWSIARQTIAAVRALTDVSPALRAEAADEAQSVTPAPPPVPRATTLSPIEVGPTTSQPTLPDRASTWVPLTDRASTRVPLTIRSSDQRYAIAFFVEGERIPRVQAIRWVCTTPCFTEAPRGRVRVAISATDGPLVVQTIDVDGPAEYRLTSRRGVGGGAATAASGLGVGLIGGLLLAAGMSDRSSNNGSFVALGALGICGAVSMVIAGSAILTRASRPAMIEVPRVLSTTNRWPRLAGVGIATAPDGVLSAMQFEF